MLADRYDPPVSTAYAAARDAYVQGCDLALTLYPGAIEAFDRAIAANPGFALAHAGKAQLLIRQGDVAAARAALTAARKLLPACRSVRPATSPSSSSRSLAELKRRSPQ
jgi:tetratricopeptide (TPR) repeat protein